MEVREARKVLLLPTLLMFPPFSSIVTNFTEGKLDSVFVFLVVGLLAGVLETATVLPTGRTCLFRCTE